MKKFILNIWYTVLYQFDQHKNEIPDWWYDDKPFDSLPVHIQRIKVAKDVIAQLECNKYRPAKGNYVRYIYDKEGDSLTFSSKDIKSTFEEIKSCEVCALGACLMSTTKFKNKLKFYDIDHGEFERSGSKVQELLLTIFTPFQIALIEGAFESGYRYTSSTRVAKHLDYDLRVSNEDISEELDQRVTAFYHRYNTSYERLEAIMENIIDNKGEFKP